jgi:hypothetical protein
MRREDGKREIKKHILLYSLFRLLRSLERDQRFTGSCAADA